jgi:two-component system, chemotaxis family, protein-glutamate methylesterase/glutaminase
MPDATALRVLVVDDSSLFRRALTRALQTLAGVTVVGSAPDGRSALTKLGPLKVDLVTLDLEMPEMDGLETLREIRRQGLAVRVVMVSSHTQSGAEKTVAALCLGADDFITKPTSSGQDNGRWLEDQLRQKLGARGPRRGASVPLTSCVPALPARSEPPPACEAVVIGSSTGGPKILAEVLGELPADLAAPIVIAQHMPALFTASLAEQLNAKVALRVTEARHGEVAQPGCVYIAPGGYHLEVASAGSTVVLQVVDAPPEQHCRPSVNRLFRSAAQVWGSRCLALVLTGMGQDGLEGSSLLTQCGATVYAQDAESCTVYGMPRAVVEHGLATTVLASDMARLLVQRTKKAGTVCT